VRIYIGADWTTDMSLISRLKTTSRKCYFSDVTVVCCFQAALSSLDRTTHAVGKPSGLKTNSCIALRLIASNCLSFLQNDVCQKLESEKIK